MLGIAVDMAGEGVFMKMCHVVLQTLVVRERCRVPGISLATYLPNGQLKISTWYQRQQHNNQNLGKRGLQLSLLYTSLVL